MDYLDPTDYGTGYYACDPQLSFNMKANKMKKAEREMTVKMEKIKKQKE